MRTSAFLIAPIARMRTSGQRLTASTSMSMLGHGVSGVDSMSLLGHGMSGVGSFASSISILLADTSISEEEVLDVTGRASDLPDPLVAVGFGLVVFLGVALLQFSLGDLTKEEGQARVRDFLQTKRDTERKRGYFGGPPPSGETDD